MFAKGALKVLGLAVLFSFMLTAVGSAETRDPDKYPPKKPDQAQRIEPMLVFPAIDGGIIQVGDTVTGAKPADDVVNYTIQLTPGEYTIDLTSPDYDTYLRILQGEDVIASNDDGGEGYNSRIEIRINQSGEYVIQADAYSSSAEGAFELSVTQTSVFTEILNETGAKEPEQPVRYTVDILPGIYTISLTSEEFDTYLRVYQGETEIARNDDGGQGTNSSMEIELTSAGEYIVEVDSFNSSGSGAFALTMTRIGETTRQSLVSERIEVINENMSFTMRTTDGQHLLYYDSFEPWSTWSVAIVDQETSNTYQNQALGEVIDPMQVVSETRMVGTWAFGGIEWTGSLELVRGLSTGQYDNVAIEWRARNTDSSPHEVGLRLILDTMIAGNDGAPFFISNVGGIDTEFEMLGDSIPQAIQVRDQLDEPTLTAELQTIRDNNVEPLDKLQLTEWSSINDNTGALDYDDFSAGRSINDSALHLRWAPRTLAPDGELVFRAIYGLGEAEIIVEGDVELSLTGPAELAIEDSLYTPNPFQVLSTVRNVGSSNLTNVNVELSLPNGLTLAQGENPVSYEMVEADDILNPAWQVQANGAQTGSLQYEVTITADELPEPVTTTRSVFVPEIGPPSTTVCDIEILDSGFEVIRGVQSERNVMLPDEVGPIISQEGDLLVATGDSTTSGYDALTLFTQAGDQYEVANIAPSSIGSRSITNILRISPQVICVVIAGNDGQSPCLLYLQTPFMTAGLESFLLHE